MKIVYTVAIVGGFWGITELTSNSDIQVVKHMIVVLMCWVLLDSFDRREG